MDKEEIINSDKLYIKLGQFQKMLYTTKSAEYIKFNPVTYSIRFD